MRKTLQENNVLFSTLPLEQTFSIIVSADRVVRYGPSCPRAELSGYTRRLPRLSLDREVDARLNRVVS